MDFDADILNDFIGIRSYGHSISTLCPALLLFHPGLGPASAERLPHYLRSRWLRIVKDVRLQGRSPDLADVVHFVADAALEVNDPVYAGLFADKRK